MNSAQMDIIFKANRAAQAKASRDLLAKAGYSVHKRSAHIGWAWDWSGPNSNPMTSQHFRSEADAWADAQAAFFREIERAREIMGILFLHGSLEILTQNPVDTHR